MSQRLIDRNPDLKRLRDEGFDVEVRKGYLILRDVPYVDANRAVQRGVLASELSLSGDLTTRPATHVIHFAGEFPCDAGGKPIEGLRNGSATQDLGCGVVSQHTFSSKPQAGYADFYEKMTTYASILSAPARAIDPAAIATTFPTIQADSDQGVFAYVDTATSRAGIAALTAKLEGQCIAIIGVGGTGSYVLDLVAKTPVREIHLFDADVFSQHNAFRAPGAASVENLQGQALKVDYLREQYSRMHRHIIAHPCRVTEDNCSALDGMTCVFLCIDYSPAKRPIIAHLERQGISFVDVGLGVQIVDDHILGIVRVTSSTPGQRHHVHEKGRISFVGSAPNEYSRNIQIADLNALNAALAVIKWKKICGFYADLGREHHSLYTIDGNHMTNEDCLCPPN